MSETENADNLIDINDFAKVDLRIAEIIEAEKLEGSSKLLKLQVSLGEELGKRQILAGIAKHYPVEELINRKIIVIANLKPAHFAGSTSEGMLLAADGAEGEVILLAPSKDAPVGSRVR